MDRAGFGRSAPGNATVNARRLRNLKSLKKPNHRLQSI